VDTGLAPLWWSDMLALVLFLILSIALLMGTKAASRAERAE
jgi:hypothetical protein